MSVGALRFQLRQNPPGRLTQHQGVHPHGIQCIALLDKGCHRGSIHTENSQGHAAFQTRLPNRFDMMLNIGL